jgi:predicted nucleic acid-binding Zn ribbon protein
MFTRPRRRLPPLGPGKRTARQRVFAQWRGVDLEPLERANAQRARRAGEILPNLLTKLRLDRRQEEAEILKVWNHLLDPSVVAHAQPTGLHKGTLFVTVDSPVWLSEIVRYRRKELLDGLQASFGRDLITRLSFRIG